MIDFITLFEGDATFSVGKKKKKRKKKKRLFKLSAMNELVKQNKFLKSKYDKLKVDAEEKLGYHWNEVVQNIIFNKFVKNIKQLMERYLAIKRELEHTEDGDNKSAAGTVDNHPTQMNEPNNQPTTPTQDAVSNDSNAPLDTRIVQEMDTGTAGNYSYETPAFGFAGSMDQFLGAWAKRNKATNANLEIVKPKTTTKTMGMNEATDLLNIDALNELFTEYFGVEPLAEEKKPDALVRLDKIKAENKKNELGYLKTVRDAVKPFVSNVESAAKDNQKHLDSKDGDKIPNIDLPKHQPDDDEKEYVELNRGFGLVDRVVLGNDRELTPEFKKRMTDQAGKEAVDAAYKKKAVQDKAGPSRIDVRNTRPVNESVCISSLYNADYNRRKAFVFESREAVEITKKEDNLTRLETSGLGNNHTERAQSLVESYDFFVDLQTNKVFKLKKNAAQSLNESTGLSNEATKRMNALIGYSPRKWVGKR